MEKHGRYVGRTSGGFQPPFLRIFVLRFFLLHPPLFIIVSSRSALSRMCSSFSYNIHSCPLPNYLPINLRIMLHLNCRPFTLAFCSYYSTLRFIYRILLIFTDYFLISWVIIYCHKLVIRRYRSNASALNQRTCFSQVVMSTMCHN